ncbi:hypothetical protein CBR_g22270 [Chara braunii]|uniref:4-(cytidine 5'-diphospho)-2-C-methyl-D-erythritol kinase n=1 Tax=Chara braunii TaxID=69332 RepID=A0A388L2Q9_CHABU|nr:hypothetical protein CBR_g22270 [Chara braunii]|eukprot:GBG76522.1 hypothetical protein CBR_g22270 [Chara braunii]
MATIAAARTSCQIATWRPLVRVEDAAASSSSSRCGCCCGGETLVVPQLSSLSSTYGETKTALTYRNAAAGSASSSSWGRMAYSRWDRPGRGKRDRSYGDKGKRERSDGEKNARCGLKNFRHSSFSSSSSSSSFSSFCSFSSSSCCGPRETTRGQGLNDDKLKCGRRSWIFQCNAVPGGEDDGNPELESGTAPSSRKEEDRRSAAMAAATSPAMAAAAAASARAAKPRDEYRKIEYVYNPKEKIDSFAQTMSTFENLPRSLTLFSPCKVNVFLRVTRKREDGFHDLASLFHVIDLGDVIKFSLSPSTRRDSLTSTVSGIPLDERNLIIKALQLYRKKTGARQYFWIHLDKKVPTGAGLGGGSGNAATALWAANQMCGGLASEKDLLEWGAEIGSDVPVFFSHGAAYVTGRGEFVEDIPSPFSQDTPLVLLKPPEECATAAVYKRFNMAMASAAADPEKLLDKIRLEGLSQDTCVNDLEPPAFQILPSLRALKQRVAMAGRGRYSAVFMSGSGSTIVAVGDPDPPSFIYDEEEYADLFVAEARFLVRRANQWYAPAGTGPGWASGDAAAAAAYEQRPEDDGCRGAQGWGEGDLMDLRLPFSYEA